MAFLCCYFHEVPLRDFIMLADVTLDPAASLRSTHKAQLLRFIDKRFIKKLKLPV